MVELLQETSRIGVNFDIGDARFVMPVGVGVGDEVGVGTEVGVGLGEGEGVGIIIIEFKKG